MAENYLGEFPVDISNSPFKDYTPSDWALEYIARYGSIDGSHHQKELIKELALILKGTPVVVVEARWGKADNIELEEYRFSIGEPSQEYLEWAKENEFDEDEYDDED